MVAAVALRHDAVAGGTARDGVGGCVRRRGPAVSWKALDVELFVQERGDPSRPAVVFVHGTGAWSETWVPAMDAVAAAGFHAVALDLPPFGYSQRPDPPRYDKREQGRRIAALLDALGLQRPTLVGHSFGGGPTVEAVLVAPERLRALVLVDAALGIREAGQAPAEGPLPVRAFSGRATASRRGGGHVREQPALHATAAAVVRGRSRGRDRRARRRLPAPADGARDDARVRRVAAGAPAAGRARAARTRRSTRGSGCRWSRCGASATRSTPLARDGGWRASFPARGLVVLPDIGHIPQIENATAFNRALVGALGALP